MSRAAIVASAALGVVVVGAVDYLTGYEISISILYLGPVALAAWYGGRSAGVAIAVVSCLGWFVADVAAGNHYSHPAVPVWNAFIRFGSFAITSLLLSALRASFLHQRHLARTDDLTGLFSRRTFEERLDHDLALAYRRKSEVTLAYLDVDDFKTVNDLRGHSEGDRLLRTTARVLKDSVRQSDTAARIGGDEFALVLPDTDALGAQQVVESLVAGLQHALTANGIEATLSIGVVTFLDPGLPMASAVAVADEVMYEVKRKGKGGVGFHVLGEAVDAARAPAPG